MQKLISLLFIVYLLIYSTISIAQQVVSVGVGNFPPFFIEKNNKGIFIEIINEIFKALPQYKIQYLYMSNHRILHEINFGKSIDVACNIFPDSQVKAYLSEPVFRYRDVAVSRKSDQLIISSTADLAGKSIAAYQGATELLGHKFKKMANANDQYDEYAHPKETTQLLLSGKKDIRVGDINIFLHDLNSKYYSKNKKVFYKNFTVHYLWPDVYSHMAFKNQHLRNEVNKVIRELKKEGEIEKIYSKYASKIN